MATITVETWADFIDAVQESGADVVLPENAVWDMNEIAPDGVSSLPTILCSTITGNGTEIRNLKTDGAFTFDPYVLTACSGLHFTNFILGGSALFNANHNTRDGTAIFTGCKYSGICGTQTRGVLLPGIGNLGDDYGQIRAVQCSFVVDAQISGAFYAAREMRYCRCDLGVPNGTLKMTAPQWSYIKCDQPTATQLNSAGALACVFDGQMGSVTTAGDPAHTYISIFCSEGLQNLTPTAYLKGVTRQQMLDPVYLASIGFPVAYNSGG